MILFSLIWLCRSDLAGVEYSSDGKTLISTPSDLKNYVIPKECEIINGGDSVLKSAFYKCRSSINTLSFEEGSQLKCIYPYVFSSTALISINLSNCMHLETLNSSLFRYSSKLKNIYLPEGIKTICSGSLSGLSSLKTFRIPDSVVTIEGYSSIHNGAIKSPITNVDISPNSNLESIGSDAFATTLLTSFYIPRNLSSITASFFSSRISTFTIHPENKFFTFHDNLLLSYDNTSIAYFPYLPDYNYTIPSTVNRIAASSCRSNPLSGITFKGKLNEIVSYAFASSNIMTIEIPESIITIQQYTFTNCQQLTTVVLPNTVKTIETNAFSNCPLLSSININEGITKLAGEAFKSDVSLINFKCPKSLTYFGNGVFTGCTNLVFDPNGNTMFSIVNNVLYVDGCKAKEFFGDSGEIVIPEYCTEVSSNLFFNKSITKVTIKSNKKLAIGNKAFYATRITSIQFPDCLESIGEYCFYDVSTLERVIIPSTAPLTSIPDYCFYGCTSLKSITLPSSIETVGIYGFYKCSNLNEISFADTSISTIGKIAFAYVGPISLIFPSTLKSIGEQCFTSSSITSIAMVTNSMYTIDSSIFKNCLKLESVTLSSSISIISGFSFSHCHLLARISLPQNITSIAANAFEYCYNLEVVVIPLNCKLNIKGQAFTSCNKLVSFDVSQNDNNFKFEEGILTNKECTKLVIFLPASKKTIYVVPATIEAIGDYAFQGCKNLRTIIIPEGKIKSVGYMSFESCTSLSSLFIPKTMDQFGISAFKNCPNLKCGSVLYENENKQNALDSGIPLVAFETECGNINACTKYNNCHSRFVQALVEISLLIVIS